jgi:aspartate aminotransferase-like enzyme
LGSYAGLSFVFAREITGSPSPTYLDLEEALRAEGPRFTVSSPWLQALEAALGTHMLQPELGRQIRSNLRQYGIEPMAKEPFASPTVTTFQAPDERFLARCQSAGYELGGDSVYLAERGLVQISTMGAIGPGHIENFFADADVWGTRARGLPE